MPSPGSGWLAGIVGRLGLGRPRAPSSPEGMPGPLQCSSGGPSCRRHQQQQGADQEKEWPPGASTTPLSTRLRLLTSQVLALLGPEAERRYGEALMGLILARGRATLDVQLAFPDSDGEGDGDRAEEGRARIHADLEVGYEPLAYACMDQDKWRNLYFRRAIAAVTAASSATQPASRSPLPSSSPLSPPPPRRVEGQRRTTRSSRATAAGPSPSSSSTSPAVAVGAEEALPVSSSHNKRPRRLLASSSPTLRAPSPLFAAGAARQSPSFIPPLPAPQQQPLAAAPQAGGLHRWLEVGPGAMGTLSRMVLDAHPHNTLMAIEAVPGSARALEAALGAAYGTSSSNNPPPPVAPTAGASASSSPFASPQSAGAAAAAPSPSSRLQQARFRVIQGLAGHVPLPPCPWVAEGEKEWVGYEALVAEVLGHLASSEGYVAILHQMGRAYPHLPRQLRAAVPRYFATKWAPVDLTPSPELDDKGLRLAMVEERLTLVQAFPFSTCTLTTGPAGVMERYDALEELQLGASTPGGLGPRLFPASTWTVAGGGQEGDRPFHGLACYIAFGEDPSPGLDALPFPHAATSCADDPYPCTNWCNAFFPVGQGQWRVRPGDRIEAQARCHVHLTEPHYDIRVAVHRRRASGSGSGDAGGGGGHRLRKRDGVGEGEGAKGVVVVYEEEFQIRYRDLLGRVDSLRAFLRRQGGK